MSFYWVKNKLSYVFTEQPHFPLSATETTMTLTAVGVMFILLTAVIVSDWIYQTDYHFGLTDGSFCRLNNWTGTICKGLKDATSPFLYHLIILFFPICFQSACLYCMWTFVKWFSDLDRDQKIVFYLFLSPAKYDKWTIPSAFPIPVYLPCIYIQSCYLFKVYFYFLLQSGIAQIH